MQPLLSLEQLLRCFPNTSKQRASLFLEPLNQTFERFEISTPPRIRMFLAQMGHESGELRYVRELASGKAYEGRADLGNNEPGDGEKFRGRGLIQVTGRNNYRLCGLHLGLPLLEKPELLEEPLFSALSAGWFWKSANLSWFADANDLTGCTKRVNGGLNGYADRLRLYQLATKEFPGN